MTRRLWTTSDRTFNFELIGLARFETQILFLLNNSGISQLDTTVKMGLCPSSHGLLDDVETHSVLVT